MSDLLLAERREHVLDLTLNRPQSRNALSRDLIAELTAALRTAQTDESVRAVILTGAPPAFCAGLDLREVATTTPTQAEQDASALVALLETLDGLRKPTIAAVNGPALGGGAGLVSVCDIVVCGASGSIGYPEVRRGLVAAVVMTYLRRVVGERQLKYLLLTGEPLTAPRALELGLVTELVPDAELIPRARHYAAMFASSPPQALAQTKALLERIRPLPHAQAIEEARRLNAAMRTSAETRAEAERFLGR
jgi:methylglutaconyl-CoA hydratase